MNTNASLCQPSGGHRLGRHSAYRRSPTTYDFLAHIADNGLSACVANQRCARSAARSVPVVWPASDRAQLPHQVSPTGAPGMWAWGRTMSDSLPEWVPRAVNAPVCSPIAQCTRSYRYSAAKYLCLSADIFLRVGNTVGPVLNHNWIWRNPHEPMRRVRFGSILSESCLLLVRSWLLQLPQLEQTVL
jgi:hypothetical protein